VITRNMAAIRPHYHLPGEEYDGDIGDESPSPPGLPGRISNFQLDPDPPRRCDRLRRCSVPAVTLPERVRNVFATVVMVLVMWGLAADTHPVQTFNARVLAALALAAMSVIAHQWNEFIGSVFGAAVFAVVVQTVGALISTWTQQQNATPAPTAATASPTVGGNFTA